MQKDIFRSELLSFIFEIRLVKKLFSKVIWIVCCLLNKKKIVSFAHILFNFVSLYLFVFTFVFKFKDANYKSHWNILNILWPRKNDVRFEYFLWKNVWFCFICIAWVHFSHKTEKIWFWKSLKYFNIFCHKTIWRQISMCLTKKCAILFHFRCFHYFVSFPVS